MTIAGVLSTADLARVKQQFGVADAQVRRDHLISHVLAAISDAQADVVFFGGTALARTILNDVRLSEDIDLIAVIDRNATGIALRDGITNSLRSTFGEVEFSPSLPTKRESDPAVLRVADVPSIQIQLLSSTGYPQWPTQITALEQRYADAPPARLQTLTPEAFVLAKLSAWDERAASRDLYDLWAIALRGFITPKVAALPGSTWPRTHPSRIRFDVVPDDATWENELAHQCRLEVGPTEAAAVVADQVRHAFSF